MMIVELRAKADQSEVFHIELPGIIRRNSNEDWSTDFIAEGKRDESAIIIVRASSQQSNKPDEISHALQFLVAVASTDRRRFSRSGNVSAQRIEFIFAFAQFDPNIDFLSKREVA
jgi:hypothetical protein